MSLTVKDLPLRFLMKLTKTCFRNSNDSGKFLEILTSYPAQYWFLADLMSQHQNNICLEYNIYIHNHSCHV